MRRQRGSRLTRQVILTAAMKTKTSSTRTIEIDLGDRKHAVCVLDAEGGIVTEQTIANTRESLTKLSAEHPGALVVIEVGMNSPWISRFLEALGHRVLVANPRKLRAIYANDRKCDRKDAEMLARLARCDERLLYPVEHSGEQGAEMATSMKVSATARGWCHFQACR